MSRMRQDEGSFYLAQKKASRKGLSSAPPTSLLPMIHHYGGTFAYLREEMLLHERCQCLQLLPNLSAFLVPMNQQRFLKFLQDSLSEVLGDLKD